MDIWRRAGINPEGEKWYQQTGLGMGQTLNVAAEKKGYTLADRGTYLALKKNLGLDILVEGDAILLNIYHVIEVNPAKWPRSMALEQRPLPTSWFRRRPRTSSRLLVWISLDHLSSSRMLERRKRSLENKS